MMPNTAKAYTVSLLLLTSASLCNALSSDTIDPSNKITRVCKNDTCSSYTSINFLPSGGAAPITLTPTAITGYAWGTDLGWVNMQPTGTGVTYSTTTGELGGHAWASASGWINFRPSNSGTLSLGIPVGVSVLPDGSLYGWAFVSGISGGWMKFDCGTSATCVRFGEQASQTPVAPTVTIGAVSYFVPPETEPLFQASTSTSATTSDTTPLNNEQPATQPSNTDLPAPPRQQAPQTPLPNTTTATPSAPQTSGIMQTAQTVLLAPVTVIKQLILPQTFSQSPQTTLSFVGKIKDLFFGNVRTTPSQPKLTFQQKLQRIFLSDVPRIEAIRTEPNADSILLRVIAKMKYTIRKISE